MKDIKKFERYFEEGRIRLNQSRLDGKLIVNIQAVENLYATLRNLCIELQK